MSSNQLRLNQKYVKLHFNITMGFFFNDLILTTHLSTTSLSSAINKTLRNHARDLKIPHNRIMNRKLNKDPSLIHVYFTNNVIV